MNGAEAPKPVHAPAAKRVDTDRLQLEIAVAHHRPQAAKHVFRSTLFLRVGVPAELEVDAPHIIALPMQQRRVVWMKRRIEPEPALVWKIRLHPYVGH